MAHNDFKKHEQTVQELLNRGFDPTFDVPTTEILGYDSSGSALRRIAVNSSGQLEVDVTTMPSVTTNLDSSDIDSGNSTTTPLGGGAVFTGTAFDCEGYSTITNTIYADQDSAVGGMEFQFCSDSSFGANTDSRKFNLEAGSQRRFQFPVTARYFRIKFTNGVTPQGAFNVQNIAHRTNTLTSIHRLGDTTTVDRSAQLVKAAIMGETTVGGGGMVNVKVNPSGTLETNAEITEPLPAGTNNIGDVDVLTQPARDNATDTITASLDTAAIMNDTTALTPKFASITATTGDTTIVSAVVGKKIRVLALFGTVDTAGTVRFENGVSGTALTGQVDVADTGGFVLPFNPVGWFETTANTLLNLELVTSGTFSGSITYVEV